MENYSKGKNVEEPLEREKIPIPNLPTDFLWMHVRGGSKIRNLLTHALNEFPKSKSVVWTGFGPSVGKAITCAEIMKRDQRDTLYQITKICYRLVEEFWDPKIPELEQLVVRRKLPMIHILLSVAPLSIDELGYQAPGVSPMMLTDEGIVHPRPSNSRKNPNQKAPHKTPTREFAALGMGSSKKRTRRSHQLGSNTKSSNGSDDRPQQNK